MTDTPAFVRDTAYFQTRRDQQMIINAEDFDLQFNQIADYCNNKLRSIINNLDGRKLPGTDEVGTANTFLRNVGDGTTEWASVGGDAINDYSLQFSKLTQVDIGSVFASGNDRVFRRVTPTEDDQSLISTADNLPIWRKLRADNFNNNTIASINIAFATITADLLSPIVTGRPLDDNSILERHILNETISGSKFTDSAIIGSKLDPALLATRVAKLNTGFVNFLPNSLENRHFLENSLLAFNYTKRRNEAQDDNVDYTFTSNNITDNSIPTNMINITRLDPNFATGSVEIRHIIPHSVNFNQIVQVGGVSNLNIRKEKLNSAIRNKLGI